jgi:hypothetical protein
MSQRVPFSFLAEYRGKAQESEFTDRETGEKVQLAANFKFEYTLADGEPDTIAFRHTALDRAATFDVDELMRGDWVHIDGVVVIGAGAERSYARLIAISVAEEPAELKAA